jgi:anti-sigma regulatory factor (Ser/Thr protein kinase)
MHTLSVKSKLSDMDKIRLFLKNSLEGKGLSEEVYFMIEVSLVEVCTNIIRYAYPGTTGDIFLKTWMKDKTFFLEVADDGVPFDPSLEKEPDIQKIIELEQKGGMGIHIFRKFMDGFDYKRENDQNILTMYKKIENAEASGSI